MTRRLLVLLTAALALAGCKVALLDINAFFAIADMSWFAEEETLFLFYEVQAEQGLSDATRVEITYTTDDAVVDWTPIDTLEPVHTHLTVDCGPDTRCGSFSLHVPLEPRNVRVRLRYHEDGELTLDPDTRFNVVGLGPPHTHRSLLVYGVFDEENRAIQWRARHRFPTLRNEEVQRLGLRRRFIVEQPGWEANPPTPEGNSYRYGATCPAPQDMGWVAVETEERAIFSPEDLPDDGLAAPAVCAQSTVFDPTGPFVTQAMARKNPEVRPAFPLLRSPIREAVPIKYLLQICDRTISNVHLEMQIQRLLMSGIEPFCIDDLEGDALTAALTTRWRQDIEVVRAGGQDMILTMAIHHDDQGITAAIETALADIIVPERSRNTPRVAGAFVFDSYAYTMTNSDAGGRTIWCPSDLEISEDEIQIPQGGFASLVCAVPPADLQLSLGPFDLGAVPILPERDRYLRFLQTYSEAEAGRMTSLDFFAPELPPDADHIDLPPFGTASFFNDEVISAEPHHEFSFCQVDDEYQLAVFRSDASPDLLPIALLPDWHAFFSEDTYGIGAGWEFPYLLEIEYVAVAALAVSAFSATLPLGIGTDVQQDYGSTVWKTGEFVLERTLTQCTLHCTHPTFDAAGIYQVDDPFGETYRNACYTPVFPQRGDSGFPRDP